MTSLRPTNAKTREAIAIVAVLVLVLGALLAVVFVQMPHVEETFSKIVTGGIAAIVFLGRGGLSGQPPGDGTATAKARSDAAIRALVAFVSSEAVGDFTSFLIG